jgi:glycosyltransferase involved in cell wall biosynthesis
MTNIIFTTPVLEHPAAGGPQLRIENSIKALGQICNLHVISQVSAKETGTKEDVKYLRNLCKSLSFVPSKSYWGTSQFILARIVRKICSFIFPGMFSYEKDIEYIVNYVQKIKANILWFGFGNISFPLIQSLRQKLPTVKFICDTDSVYSRYVLRELDVESDPVRRKMIQERGEKKIIEERKMTETCDVTTAVSEIDAEYYRSICVTPAKIHIFSNGIDIAMYKSHSSPPISYKTPAIFLGGSFFSENSPMVYGARWVINEIMPLVWQKYPDVCIYLVGRGSDKFLVSFLSERVIATGKVDSVLPYLQNASCALVPLFFESGTRFKIMEAGACGIPVISTTLGAEGIPVVDERDCLIADTPADFAKSILRILEDKELEHKLSKNCHNLIKENYGIEALMSEASKIINYLMPGQ